MRSTSMIKFMRTSTHVPVPTVTGIEERLTDWHAVVPGYGGEAPWPGLACNTLLEGSLQQETYVGMENRPGEKIHDECRRIVDAYVNEVVLQSDGPGVFTVGRAAPLGSGTPAGPKSVGDAPKRAPARGGTARGKARSKLGTANAQSKRGSTAGKSRAARPARAADGGDKPKPA